MEYTVGSQLHLLTLTELFTATGNIRGIVAREKRKLSAEAVLCARL